MDNILFLFFCLFLGLLLQYVKSLPQNMPSTLGGLILYVPLPALCLLSIPDLEWKLSLVPLGLVAWIVFGLAYFFFTFLGKKYSWEKELVGCLILTGGFCNSAFVGFPVIEALYGKEALKSAIFLDQAGSFLIVSSFGIWVATHFSVGVVQKRFLIKKIIFFPPFMAFLAAIVMSLLDVRPTGLIREFLEKLVALLTPLALITVGLQLKWTKLRENISYLGLGLFFKLLFAPLVIFVLYYFLGAEKLVMNIAVMESGMATMITASILASTHKLRPELSSMMVGVGVPFSFLTLSFLYFLLEMVSNKVLH